MNKLIVLFIIIICYQDSFAQSRPHAEAEDNMLAYWNYQRKLEKYFIIEPGNFNVPGSGMPASYFNICPNHKFIKWGDSPIDLGWYISKLALELYLLTTTGEDTTDVVEKLYQELSTINRLDAFAEDYENGSSTPQQCSLEGYFLRDDVLGVPGIHTLGSDYTQYQYDSDFKSLNNQSSPTSVQESQDQIIYLLMGLKCVTDWVPYSVTYKNLFDCDSYYGATSSLKQEARNIADRLCYYGRDRINWVTHQTPHNWEWTILDNVTQSNVHTGSDMFPFSKGFDGSQKNIIGHSTASLPTPSWNPINNMIATYQWACWLTAKHWWTLFNYLPLNADNEHKFETLAAMSNNSFEHSFFPKTKTAVLFRQRSQYFHFDHIPLFYAVSDTAPCLISDNYYWDLLNDANATTGAYRYTQNSDYPSIEWSSTQRFVHPGRRYPGDPQGFLGEYNNLDYMFLFNLFYKKNWSTLPPYLNGIHAHISSLVNFPYHGYGSTSEPYTVQSFETIQAVNNVSSSSVLTYRAGVYIELNPGFTAELGSDFLAYIDPFPEDVIIRHCAGLRLGSAQNNLLNNSTDKVNINLNEQNNFIVSPNPVGNSITNLNFILENDGVLMVELYNQYSQKIKLIDKKLYTAGEYIINIDLIDIPPGCYYLKIIFNNEFVLTRKLIKQ